MSPSAPRAGELWPSGAAPGAALQRRAADVVPAVRREGGRAGGGEEGQAGGPVQPAAVLRSGHRRLQGADRDGPGGLPPPRQEALPEGDPA